MNNEPKVRYSDEDLQEFKELIDNKIAKAEEEYKFTESQILELNENGFKQQGGDMYDDSSSHAELELLQRMALRQQRHIQDLRNALLRIQNKTYGICTVTGKLIEKQRLRLVPHATKSVDGKNQIGSEKIEPSADATFHDPFLGPETSGSRPAGKTSGDRLRIAQPKAPGTRDDWEPDNETMEDAGYNLRKLEDEEE